MKFMFVCGGTAGHINPALAVAGKIRDIMPDSSFLFVGSGREMENRLIPQEGFELKNITITGFSRGFKPDDIKKNIGTVKNLSISKKESDCLLNEFRPDVVVGMGGYVCYPVLNAASKQGIPTVMHESNAIPGLTTKMLSGIVDKVMVAFPNTENNYKKPERVVFTGTPIRNQFEKITREEAKKKLGIKDKPLVVSFWGSLGADFMNGYIADIIKLNSASGEFSHIHSTGNGKAGVEKMVGRLKRHGVYDLPGWIDIRPYIDDMGTVMRAADLVLCRAGASTLAELTGIGRASILVPSPNVTNNHQEKNARELEKSGATIVITENVCTGDVLYNKIIELVRNKERLALMEKAAFKFGRRDAASEIVKVIMSLIN